MRRAFSQRALAGLDDRVGRRKVRLSDFEVEYPRAFTLHGQRALEHLHGEERLDLCKALRSAPAHGTEVATPSRGVNRT